MWLSTLSVCNSLPRKLLHLYIDLAKHSDAKTLEHPPPFPCCYSHYTISLSVSQHKSKKNKNKKTKEETNFNLSFPTQKPTSKPLLSFTISHHHPKRFKILAQHTHKPIPPLCISVSLFFSFSLSLSPWVETLKGRGNRESPTCFLLFFLRKIHLFSAPLRSDSSTKRSISEYLTRPIFGHLLHCGFILPET